MAQQRTFALHGTVVHAPVCGELECLPMHYLVCEDGMVAGAFPTLPDRYKGIPVTEHGDRMMIPGLCDLHVHAPQYAFRGLGMDLELLEWLNTHTFPEEARYQEQAYAERAYRMFVNDLASSATTRACVFATIHSASTMLLMRMLEGTGLRTMVGKVNMDRNCPDYYVETTAASLAETQAWLEACTGSFTNTRPILTPRFIPTCSEELMQGLERLRMQYDLAVQSHLAENRAEIEWVKSLCPNAGSYAQAYDRFGMLGGTLTSVMAHCVYPQEEDFALLRARGTFVAHCPTSNTGLSSGVAPVRRYLDEGVRVGLGSDVAGGYSLSLFRVMCEAVQASKLRWRLLEDGCRPLTAAEVFYLATKGGGALFGKVGSFEEGYEFDAVVLDDRALSTPRALEPAERLERLIYLSDERQIVEKFTAGVRVTEGPGTVQAV